MRGVKQRKGGGINIDTQEGIGAVAYQAKSGHRQHLYDREYILYKCTLQIGIDI